MTTRETRPGRFRRRITLDAQLVSYWEREAQRLDALAAGSGWAWIARRYARRAEAARAKARISQDREAGRAPAVARAADA